MDYEAGGIVRAITWAALLPKTQVQILSRSPINMRHRTVHSESQGDGKSPRQLVEKVLIPVRVRDDS